MKKFIETFKTLFGRQFQSRLENKPTVAEDGMVLANAPALDLKPFKEFMVPHDNMVRSLEEARQTNPAFGKIRYTKGFLEQSNYENPNVVSPSEFLGEGYGNPIHWENKDDMFVEFQILDSVVMNDVDFFLRYVGEDADGMCSPRPLAPEEKVKYPLHIFPCFAECAEVVSAQMTKPLQHLNADQECFVVAYENVLGLLVFGNSDTVDIARRSVGFEDEKDKLHYQIQFMRFDKAAIERMDLAYEPAEYYRQMHFKGFPTLRVNFAKYNNE